MAAMLCLTSTALAVSAPGELEFHAEPGAGSQTDQHGSYFVIATDPAAQVSQWIDLTNNTARPMMLRLSPARATTGPLGGVSYAADSDATVGEESWIKLDRSTVRLAAHASTRVQFTVSVPAGATAGTHVSGLAIATVTEAQKSSQSAGSGTSINVLSRRVIAVQTQLPGLAIDNLFIEGVSTAARADAMYLQVHLRNSGNTLLATAGEIRLARSPGFRRPLAVETMVPGTAIEYPIKWTSQPRAGTYHATVKMLYKDRIVNWSGTFRVGNHALRKYSDRSSAPAPGQPISTLLIVAGALALAVTGLLLGLLLRRRSVEAT